MLTRLTLTIDAEILRQATEYARRRNQSGSRMVEDFLRGMSGDEEWADGAAVTASIAGMFKDEYRGHDYDRLLEDELNDENA